MLTPPLLAVRVIPRPYFEKFARDSRIQFLSTLQRRTNTRTHTRRDYSPINLPLSRCETHHTHPPFRRRLPPSSPFPVPRKRRECSAQIAINSADSHGGHRYVSPRP